VGGQSKNLEAESINL